jgi:PEP-CTERM motif
MINKFSVKHSRLSFAALFGVLLSFSATVQGAIVTNGGFEANTDLVTPPWPTAPLTGWTKGEIVGTGVPGQNRVDGLDPIFLYALAPHSGNIATAFNSDSDTVTKGGFATLTQALATDITKTYDVSLWVANPIMDAGNFNNAFSVSWDGALVTLSGTYITETAPGSKTYKVTPNTTWFEITASFLPVTGTSTSLVVSGRNSDWATLVDDVSIVETPEPTTLAMLGTAFLVMGLRRNRHGRAARS